MNTMTEKNPDKRLAFETAYEKGKVRVLFDMTHPGVKLPDVARKSSPDGRGLALDYSRTFHMPNFKVTDDGIWAQLTFANAGHLTFVPWASVHMIMQGGQVLERWDGQSPPVDVFNTSPIKVLSIHDAPAEVQELLRKIFSGEEDTGFLASPNQIMDEEGMDPSMKKWFAMDVAEG